MCLPGKFGLFVGSTKAEITEKTMKTPPIVARAISCEVERAKITGGSLEDLSDRCVSSLSGSMRMLVAVGIGRFRGYDSSGHFGTRVV